MVSKKLSVVLVSASHPTTPADAWLVNQTASVSRLGAWPVSTQPRQAGDDDIADAVETPVELVVYENTPLEK